MPHAKSALSRESETQGSALDPLFDSQGPRLIAT